MSEQVKTVKCGGYRCENFIVVKGSAQASPVVPICQSCEKRINAGIVMNLHLRTGKLSGNFNSIDGYKP